MARPQHDGVHLQDGWPFHTPPECIRDHSTQVFCPVHGWDPALSPPKGYVWRTIRTVTAINFTVPIPIANELPPPIPAVPMAVVRDGLDLLIQQAEAHEDDTLRQQLERHRDRLYA